jgi:predicted enzyme related to lactoylglutathione lyase
VTHGCSFDTYDKIAAMHMRGALVYVKDLERMRRFYSDLLGMSPANQNWTDAWAAFDNGAVRFALHAIPADMAATIEIASPPVPRETGAVKLIFQVEDVETTLRKLESLGAQAIRRAWQKKGVACDAIDPEGNIFQICASGSDALE